MNDLLRKFLIKIHISIPISLIVLPLILPKKILKYTFFIPIFMPLVWLKYNGCPISNLEKKHIKGVDNSDHKFIKKLLNPILGELTDIQVEHICTVVLMLSIIISTIRLMK